MIGEKEKSSKLMVTVSLENLVPEDDFYRRVDRVLNLGYLYQKCKKYYGKTGRHSIDPVVFFKILLYGYFEGITSDRELVKRISDSLSGRLFVGYDLDEELPWHSTISRTRGIIGEEVFEGLFTEIVSICIGAGLIEGQHQSVDSTLVRANASLESLERKKPAMSVNEYLNKTKENEKGEEKRDDDSNDPFEGVKKSQEEGETKLSVIEKEPGSVKGRREIKKTSNEDYQSKTDPDSRITKKAGTPTGLYYKTQYTADAGNGVITDVMTVHGNKADQQILIESLKRSKKRLEKYGLQVDTASADKGYISGKNLKEMTEMGISGFIPIVKGTNKNEGYDESCFKYDEAKNEYICPAGEVLAFKQIDEGQEMLVYRCNPKKCNECRLREKCTKSKTGRKVSRSVHWKEYAKLRERMQSGKGRIAMRIRKSTVERLFGEAKENHCLRKFMTRGLAKAQKNSYLIASVQNLKRILNSRKRRFSGANTIFDAIKDEISFIMLKKQTLLQIIFKIKDNYCFVN
jgi:transposase